MQMPQISRQQWNFTLVELMVAMAILVIMMGFLFQFVNGARRIWTASASTAEAFDDAQIVLQVMENDLKHLIQHCEYDYGARTLCLRYIDEDTTKYLIFPIGQDSSGNPAIIIYIYNNGKLYRKQLPIPNQDVFEIFHKKPEKNKDEYKVILKEFINDNFSITDDTPFVCDEIDDFNVSCFPDPTTLNDDKFPDCWPYNEDTHTHYANYRTLYTYPGTFSALRISLSLSAGTFVAGQDDESTRKFSKFVFLL